MAAGDTYEFGPGTLTIGEVGSEIDVSCQVNSLVIKAAKEQGESKTMLCGTKRIPKATYTHAMTGNIDIDITDPAGLWALSQIAPGSEAPFTYTPSTEAGTVATGVVQVDPMDFGGQTYGEIMNSDVEWLLTAAPTYSIDGSPLVPAVP